MSGPCFLPLQTSRLVLRRMQSNDAERFAEYRADAELARYQGWKPISPVEAVAFIAEMRCAPSFVEETWLQIAIAELPERAIVGDIGFCLHAGGELEFGFTLRRQSQGKGFATEAVKAFVHAMLQRSGIRHVFGVVDARNKTSIRVLERLGMKLVSSEDAIFKGEPCTEHRYQLERSEHRSRSIL